MLLAGLLAALPSIAGTCDQGVAVQVLGSGELKQKSHHAGSSYLIWIDGKARLMVNTGSGSALRFGESRASFRDLEALVFTQLSTAQSTGLPGLISAAHASGRRSPLPIFGPDGSKFMPSTVNLIRTLFDSKRGAWRELGSVLSPLDKRRFKLKPHDIRTRIKGGKPQLKNIKKTNPVFVNKHYRLTAKPVNDRDHSPALAWRVDIGKQAVVFADYTGMINELAKFSRNADILVIPLTMDAATYRANDDRNDISQLANAASVKRLLLTHYKKNVSQKTAAKLAHIRQQYRGDIDIAKDLTCYPLGH